MKEKCRTFSVSMQALISFLKQILSHVLSRYALMFSIKKNYMCFVLQFALNNQCTMRLLPAVIIFCKVRISLVEKVDLRSIYQLSLFGRASPSAVFPPIMCETLGFTSRVYVKPCSHNKVVRSLFDSSLGVYGSNILSIWKQKQCEGKNVSQITQEIRAPILLCSIGVLKEWERIG